MLIPVYVLLLLVMFVLPFFSVDEYSIREHTLSELGAQGAPHAWAMNLVFGALGLASVADGWPRLPGLWFHRLALLLFGLALVFVAIFQHAPIPADAPVSAREDEWHSNFSGLVGMSFVAFAVASAFGSSGRGRSLGPAAGAFAMAMSFLIFSVPDYAGVWQRLMFGVSFAWLILVFWARPTSWPRRPPSVSRVMGPAISGVDLKKTDRNHHSAGDDPVGDALKAAQRPAAPTR
ncbi:MAG: DUF998 domain-containing protein [Thermoleophilia bacterium]|nr:DUF998 domain-containing protein [Thermoleophilia bacterium]MDH3725387.1 DUF998 domain-containing protein [Thermoleophilia bacterium]